LDIAMSRRGNILYVCRNAFGIGVSNLNNSRKRIGNELTCVIRL
jgi:hypothetical protein